MAPPRFKIIATLSVRRLGTEHRKTNPALNTNSLVLVISPSPSYTSDLMKENSSRSSLSAMLKRETNRVRVKKIRQPIKYRRGFLSIV